MPCPLKKKYKRMKKSKFKKSSMPSSLNTSATSHSGVMFPYKNVNKTKKKQILKDKLKKVKFKK